MCALYEIMMEKDGLDLVIREFTFLILMLNTPQFIYCKLIELNLKFYVRKVPLKFNIIY